LTTINNENDLFELFYKGSSYKNISNHNNYCLQCFDTAPWTPGRASGLYKNWVMRCWRGHLYGTRRKWCAYGPADANATLTSLASLKFKMVSPFWCWLVLKKKLLNGYRSVCLAIITRISCRWQTDAMRCITVNMQVHARCDKLATELSWQCFASKVDNRQFSATSPAFAVHNLHLVPSLGVTLFQFCRDFWHQKTYSPWATMWHRLHDPTFSHFSRTPTCDAWTNRRTDRHTVTDNIHAS